MQSVTLSSGLERKSALSRAAASLKLRIRALAYPLATRSWLDLLNSHPHLRAMAHAQPRLIHKVYRPWLSKSMCRRGRLAALVAHYRFIVQQGLGQVVEQAAREPVVLARFLGKNGAHYSIELRAIVPMEREGELVMQLYSGDTLVYSVAFSFLVSGRQAQIGIGCIQGPQCGAGLELARETTKDLHGLRPKHLLVKLVRQLGHAYGCSHMILVGNKNRTTCQKSLRKGKVKADYDSMWQEMGAAARRDGDYELACEALQALDLSDVASKKRAEARRRHELLESITNSLLDQLAPSAIKVHQDAPAARQRSRIEIVTAACAVAN